VQSKSSDIDNDTSTDGDSSGEGRGDQGQGQIIKIELITIFDKDLLSLPPLPTLIFSYNHAKEAAQQA
jgi:hypothetical protein